MHSNSNKNAKSTKDISPLCFILSKKLHFDSFASCGSTHKIEFAEQIHKFREHVSRNLYKGRKNVPVRRGFSSKFDRKRGFDREAARKTLVFRQPQAADFRLRLRSRLPGPANLRCLSRHNLRCVFMMRMAAAVTRGCYFPSFAIAVSIFSCSCFMLFSFVMPPSTGSPTILPFRSIT